jgi:ELWxxDGT repeat protein
MSVTSIQDVETVRRCGYKGRFIFDKGNSMMSTNVDSRMRLSRERSRRTARVSIAMAFVTLCTWITADAASFVEVKDVYAGSSDGVTPYLVGSENFLFFWGMDATHLLGDPYVSDGTTNGTHLIADVMGSSGNFPLSHNRLNLNSKVYLVFDDGIHGQQLWVSDGTSPGTLPLTSFTGPADDGAGIVADGSGTLSVIPVGDRVWFTAKCPSSSDRCFYSSDGTVIGTKQELTTFKSTRSMVAMDGSLFVRVGQTLYFTDGTSAGMNSLGTGFTLGSLEDPVAVNEFIFFPDNDATGNELWTSDGTQNGTVRVADLNAGVSNSSPQMLTRVDDRVFFTALTPVSGRELWVSNGTVAGTTLVKDIRPGVQDSAIAGLTAINGRAFFYANDGVHGFEPWISDGTSAGTVMLKDIVAGSADGVDTFAAPFTTGGLVFFTGWSTGGRVLWSTDGTVAGTKLVDANVSIYSGSLAARGGKLYGQGHRFVGNSDDELYAMNLLDYDHPIPGYSRMCIAPEHAIPDAASMTSTIVLPSYATLRDLRVTIDAGHTFVGDLSFTLTHSESGKILQLSNLGGSCDGKLIDIGFSDAASSTAGDVCHTGRPAFPRDTFYKPDEPLSTLNGEAVAGHWTLTVTDNAAGDVGTLHNWCMVFNTTDHIFLDSLE